MGQWGRGGPFGNLNSTSGALAHARKLREKGKKISFCCVELVAATLNFVAIY
jgi:hypothetical protein